MSIVFCLMIRRPPRSTRTDTLFPYTTLFRSDAAVTAGVKHIVYVSSLGTRAAEEPEVWDSYYATEQALMRKAPAWSILRMGYYIKSFIDEAKQAFAHGALVGFVAEPVSFAETDDISDAGVGICGD